MEQTKKMPREKKSNQPDKTQSEKVQKPQTYDFFPTARAAFIGNWISELKILSVQPMIVSRRERESEIQTEGQNLH